MLSFISLANFILVSESESRLKILFLKFSCAFAPKVISKNKKINFGDFIFKMYFFYSEKGKVSNFGDGKCLKECLEEAKKH